MRYCSNCGNEVKDYSVVCINCGAPVKGSASSGHDASSVGYAVLAAFFPIIGLILWLVWKEEYPLRAKSAGKGALIGVILNLILVIIQIAILGSMT